ncbi:hypothetical protein [Haemophilus pittmaniae]|jgi:hypothetical protein|uniref:hypothetical protein n=1 Tax=Haemophilus pittmaniae TaxID=249188 RepID=UPI0028DB6E3B|nr:hypothetical protein [Haemophilus pittmaniae]
MATRPYFKTLLVFPLLTQLLVTIVLFFTTEFDATDSMLSKLAMAALIALAVATLPALLIALWVRAHRYARYALKGIVLIAFLIGFFYTNISAVVYLTFTDEEMGFAAWLAEGGVELTLMIAVGFSLYSVLVLPLLLPKTRPVA